MDKGKNIYENCVIIHFEDYGIDGIEKNGQTKNK